MGGCGPGRPGGGAGLFVNTLRTKKNNVNHPKHYCNHKSGIECIQVTEHFNFCLGNALKYIWRADLKDDAIEDIKKAIWYLERELAKRIIEVEHGK